MADFDDQNAEDEFESDDEMEVDEQEADQEQDQDGDAGAEDEEDENEEDDEDNDEYDDDAEGPETPSHRQSAPRTPTAPGHTTDSHPSVVLTAPSPSHRRTPSLATSYLPPTRPEALVAQAYDIVPTMAAPQSTSINAIAVTPDMHWVFSGGTDGYVRMYNWVETANGKVPLTVAQKHPFVDSVMKAGSLVTYWENEDTALRTPSKNEEESKWISPVYSLATQHQALWLLSGTESGSIYLQTCRHQAGTRITTLKEHTSAVSVLSLSQDETKVLSGSWDKKILDWDLNAGKVKRSFLGSVSQISAVEVRPESSLPIPEVSEYVPELPNGTFSSNNGAPPFSNGFDDSLNPPPDMNGGEADAAGSPDGSLFGENADNDSLFGGDGSGGGATAANAFGEDDDLAQTLANELQDAPGEDADAPGEEIDIEMAGMGDGGPVQAPDALPDISDSMINGTANAGGALDLPNGEFDFSVPDHQFPPDDHSTAPLTNGLPHLADGEPLTAPTTTDSPAQFNTTASAADLPLQSESTFLSTSIDGTIRLWDRRMNNPIAILRVPDNTPAWCTGACWSPDGNFFYAGRRNNAVDEYSIHKMSSSSPSVTGSLDKSQPNRTFTFQAGSGPVYAVRAMPNSRHLVCASQDILRIYDLKHEAGRRQAGMPFTILPGHRGGVISSVYVDPTCRFMLSAAGNRGYEGLGTEVLLGYEINVQDSEGVWHK